MHRHKLPLARLYGGVCETLLFHVMVLVIGCSGTTALSIKDEGETTQPGVSSN